MVTSVIGQGVPATCNHAEPWEMHQLYDFSWNNSNYGSLIQSLSQQQGHLALRIFMLIIRLLVDARDFFERRHNAGCKHDCFDGWFGYSVGSKLAVFSITFSTSQSGLTGLAFVASGDATGRYNTLITGGSGTSWTLSSPYKGPTNSAATWSTFKAH